VIIDPVEQVAELEELCERGFISADDLERQRAKVLGSGPAQAGRLDLPLRGT
jgi:hypothetical protein